MINNYDFNKIDTKYTHAIIHLISLGNTLPSNDTLSKKCHYFSNVLSKIKQNRHLALLSISNNEHLLIYKHVSRYLDLICEANLETIPSIIEILDTSIPNQTQYINKNDFER